MTNNDNSVNIKSPADRYHHGDLRAALVAEALRLLANSDAEALSLRGVARNVGVSATAVYRHFPNKSALLHALARAGGEALAREQQAAMAAAGGGAAGFDATGRAYVRFAIANPALFRLMTAETRGVDASAASHRGGGLQMLYANTDALAPPDSDAAARHVLAVQSWALVHGLALLMLDGQIAADDQLIDRVIDSKRKAFAS
jgi:AcrR family transcriptional regulator